MKLFVQKHCRSIIGILSGFDRLVFRGTLRQLAYAEGMKTYLSFSDILLKDFSRHVQQATQQVKEGATAVAEKNNRPLIYLESPRESKEEMAQKILRRDKIERGLICVFTAVEPCRSYDIFRNREKKKLELVLRRRKCLHVYQYGIDPVFGFMSARIQTWYPFNIQICINGREWLSRQMDKAGLLYLRRDNCFPRINNVEKAQTLMDRQLETNWPDDLDRIAGRLNPAHPKIFGEFEAPYYGSAFQTEWATDIMFKDRASLDALYPSLIHHGLTTFQSPDVMRFLGHKLSSTGHVDGHFQGEVVSDMKHRTEGVRTKHRINGNSLKAYNKEGSILRIEATINEPEGFKVYRPKEGQDKRKREWLPMRRGIADLQRRADVSQAANNRYLDTLAVVDVPAPVKTLVQDILKPTTLHNQRVRAINPGSENDAALLESVMRGEFAINGFRNRDLRPLLFSSPSSSEEGGLNLQTGRRSPSGSILWPWRIFFLPARYCEDASGLGTVERPLGEVH
ncbi:MAG TPA: hypothetical protein VI895_07525 [Bdellovibrionota bacterium]|nr:hypothetical protein [Bdellovibrionota bacterium]